MNWGLGWGENGHKIITNKGNAFQGALLCKRSFVFVEHYKEDVAAELKYPWKDQRHDTEAVAIWLINSIW